jgi:hypothetical protein
MRPRTWRAVGADGVAFLAALGAIFGLVVTAHYRFMPAGSMKVDDPTG